jgi:hypothetical protein
MPTTTRVQHQEKEQPDGSIQVQHITTIPKGLAEAIGAHKDNVKIVWGVQSGNTLSATVSADD